MIDTGGQEELATLMAKIRCVDMAVIVVIVDLTKLWFVSRVNSV